MHTLLKSYDLCYTKRIYVNFDLKELELDKEIKHCIQKIISEGLEIHELKLIDY